MATTLRMEQFGIMTVYIVPHQSVQGLLHGIARVLAQAVAAPLDPNQPYNPFYGIPSSSFSRNTPQNEPLPTMPTDSSSNPYSTTLRQQSRNTSNSNADIASAPSVEDIDSIDPSGHSELKLVEEFKSMDMKAVHSGTVHFQLAATLSLQSSMFKSWVSFHPNTSTLCAVTTKPMVNERFVFQCIDEVNKIYTIKTCNGLYLSAERSGAIRFVPRVSGIYEQWKVSYHHINQITITSRYDQTHLGIDAHGLFHHKYPSITAIVQFTVSPPVQLTKYQQNMAISAHHLQAQSAVPTANKEILWPKLVDGMLIALRCCVGDGYHLGVEHLNSKTVSTQYTTCRSFDGELLARSTFKVHRDPMHRLFALQSTLNGKYLSPSRTADGRMCLVESGKVSDREYFNVIWHDWNVISIQTYHGTLCKIEHKNGQRASHRNVLFHKGYDWRSTLCAFEVISKHFERLNRGQRDNAHIPSPQLPVRTVQGSIKRDIWLKGRGSAGYLAFRSKPYRFEAVSQMMGKWETIRFQHDETRNNSHKCVVSLFTSNGMVMACDAGAQLTFLTKDDENDTLRCRWSVYFLDYALISIRNEKYKGWLCLRKHIKNGVPVLSIMNPNFDENGSPVINVENARQFKKTQCQFELWPLANCKDEYSESLSSTSAHTQNNLTFAM